ncbi:hypothetical protein [Legionella sp. PC997]|uniref:hypothetical protein n=1 Tax=Legionella sp. PC997 TaxID=2755562 RepID=UPI0015FA4327|nr:hypothetical protein [Legionella sp. PC997]
MLPARIFFFEALIKSFYSHYIYENSLAKKLQKRQALLDLSSLEKEFEIWKQIIQTLDYNTRLEYLICHKLPESNVTSDFIKLLTTALKKNSHLKSLSLINSPIGNTEAPFIAELLQNNTTLKEIDLTYTNFDAKGVDTIAHALQDNKSLQILRLRGCTVAGVTDSLLEILSKHPSLEELNLNDCSLQIDSGLTQLLTESHSLKNLNLGINYFGRYYIDYLTEGLKGNKNLIKLDLVNCSLDKSYPEGLEALTKALMVHPTLTHLNLSSNGLDSTKYPVAAELVKNNSSLKQLKLSGNAMGNAGVQHLATALKNNNALATLVLSNNQIGDEGLKHLSEALLHNNTLVHLDLVQNDFNSVRSLCDSLQNNISITAVDVDKKGILDNSMEELELLLKRNQRIKSTYLLVLKEAESKKDLHGMIRVLKEMKHEFQNKEDKVWTPAQLGTIYNASLEFIKFKLGEELVQNQNKEQNLLHFIDIYVKAIPLLNDIQNQVLSAVSNYINTTPLTENESKWFMMLRTVLGGGTLGDESLDEESVAIFKKVMDILTQKIVSNYDDKIDTAIRPTVTPFKKYYNQDDFIEKQRRDVHYGSLNRARLRFSGLCELICNYIIKEDLLGFSAQNESLDSFDLNRLLPQNLNDIHLLAGLYQLNNDWVIGSHILDTSSSAEKFAAYFLNKYPYSLFTFSEVSPDKKQVDAALLSNKLAELKVGTYIKFKVFSKSFGKMEGHSMLIKKNHDDTYSFFDPNKGEQLQLSSLELCDKLNKSMKLYDGTHMAFLDGIKYIKSLRPVSSNPSLSRTHLDIMKIDPLDRRKNIDIIYNILSSSLFYNEEKNSPRYINELKNILTRIDYNNESNIVKNLIEIKKISKMEPDADENTHVQGLRDILNSPTSNTFAAIRENLYQDPNIKEIMDELHSPEQNLAQG